jgi:hypothetical protein
MNLAKFVLGNWEATLVSALLGWLTAGFLLLSGRSSKYVMLPAYFALLQVSTTLTDAEGGSW